MHFPYYLVIKQKEGVIKPLNPCKSYITKREKEREREIGKEGKDNPFADMFFR